MLFLPKVKKDDPCLKATKKVKSLVASLLAAVAVAVSGAAYAGPTSMHDSGMSTEIMQVDQSSGSVRISVSGEVIPGAAQRGCPLFFVMQYARPDAIARVV